VDDSQPLYLQLAREIERQIVEGGLKEGDQIPSTNELAAFYRINPATAGKGVNQLLAGGLVEKRRGIGMFVAPGAAERLRSQRRARFADEYLEPLLAEARRLGISLDDLTTLIHHTAGARPAGQSSGV